MRLRVRLFGVARSAAGTRELTITIEGSATVREALELLEHEQSGLTEMLLEKDALSPGIDVLLNGRNIRHDGLDTVLTEGDVLSICPPIMGGCH